MDNLAHTHTYKEDEKMDFEMRLYRERRRRQQEEEYKEYIRDQRILGMALLVVSILSFPWHQEGMFVVYCGMLGVMPWIPEKRR